MNLKTLIVSSVIASLTTVASAQFSSSGYDVNIGFGGSYSRTNISTPRGNTTVTNTSLGGGINVGFGGSNANYGGAPYGGGCGAVVPAPVVLPYYGGQCAPVYLPYSPFTNCYGVGYSVPAPFIPCGREIPGYPAQFIVR